MGQLFSFDGNGDPPAVYDIVNWKVNVLGGIDLTSVGIYDASIHSGNPLRFFPTGIIWNVKNNEVKRDIYIYGSKLLVRGHQQ